MLALPPSLDLTCAQPTWEETQTVVRVPAGMATVSTISPSPSPTTSFTVPQLCDVWWVLSVSQRWMVGCILLERACGAGEKWTVMGFIDFFVRARPSFAHTQHPQTSNQ